MPRNDFRRRVYLIIGVFTVLSMLLTACAAPAPQAPAPAEAPKATEPPAAVPATEAPASPPAAAKMIEMYHDKVTWAENTDKMGQAAAAATGVGFTSVANADTTAYQATTRAALSSDKAPDIFSYWSGYRMEDIIKAGLAADLTDVWKKYIDSGEYSQAMADAFSFDGKVYGFPLLTSYWVIYYNKPLFEQNGLKPPTTWDEFIALNDTLVAKGITPMAQTFVDRWQAFIMFEEMIMRTQGPEFYDKLMRGEAKYTDPEVVEAMMLWKELMDKGYLTNDYSFGTAENTFLQAFQDGKVAMVAIGDWYSTSLIGAGLEPGKDFDAFILPNKNADLPPALFLEAGPLLVGENSPNKEDAMKVADWWMSVPAQDEWSGMTGFLPANSQAAAPSVVSKSIQDWINTNQAQPRLRYWEATPADIVDAAVDEFARFMSNPDQYMVVLEAIQQKADQVWAERQ